MADDVRASSAKSPDATLARAVCRDVSVGLHHRRSEAQRDGDHRRPRSRRAASTPAPSAMSRPAAARTSTSRFARWSSTSEGNAEFGVGSGIVWDSVDRDEYAECVLKASILLRDEADVGPATEFELLGDAEVVPRRRIRSPRGGTSPGSLTRLITRGSVVAEPSIRAALLSAVQGRTSEARVRLRVARDGTAVCEVSDLTPPPAILRAALASAPVDAVRCLSVPQDDTPARLRRGARVASGRRRGHPVERGRRGHGRRGPQHRRRDRRTQLTPPVECGLLAGTLRAEMLETVRWRSGGSRSTTCRRPLVAG